MKHVPLYIVRNSRTGALYTPVPVDGKTALRILGYVRHSGWLSVWPVGYGIPYVGVFRL